MILSQCYYKSSKKPHLQNFFFTQTLNDSLSKVGLQTKILISQFLFWIFILILILACQSCLSRYILKFFCRSILLDFQFSKVQENRNYILFYLLYLDFGRQNMQWPFPTPSSSSQPRFIKITRQVRPDLYLTDFSGQMLKGPGLKSSVLHQSVH